MIGQHANAIWRWLGALLAIDRREPNLVLAVFLETQLEAQGLGITGNFFRRNRLFTDYSQSPVLGFAARVGKKSYLRAPQVLEIRVARSTVLPFEIGTGVIGDFVTGHQRDRSDSDMVLWGRRIAACNLVPKAVVHFGSEDRRSPFVRGAFGLKQPFFVRIGRTVAIENPERIGLGGIWNPAADFDGKAHGPANGDGDVARFGFDQREPGARSYRGFGERSKSSVHERHELARPKEE